MKNLFFVLFTFTLCFNIKAQDFGTKGTIETGGSVSFSSTTTVSNGESDVHSLTTFTFEPYIGHFVADGLELGFMPAIMYQSFRDQSLTVFGIFFTPSYNFITGSSAYPFIEGRVGYTSQSFNDGQYDATASGLSFGGRAGVKINVSGSSLLNIGIDYMLLTYNSGNWDGDRNGQNVLSISAGWTVFF